MKINGWKVLKSKSFKSKSKQFFSEKLRYFKEHEKVERISKKHCVYTVKNEKQLLLSRNDF